MSTAHLRTAASPAPVVPDVDLVLTYAQAGATAETPGHRSARLLDRLTRLASFEGGEP
jgi:hypothetical protein